MRLKKLDLLTSILFFGFLYSTTASAQPTNIEPSSDTAQATDEQQKTPVQASLVSPKRHYEARVSLTFLSPAAEFAHAPGDGAFAIYGGIQGPEFVRFRAGIKHFGWFAIYGGILGPKFMGFRAGAQYFVTGSFYDGGWFVNGSALYSPPTKTDEAYLVLEAGVGKRWVMRNRFSIELQGGALNVRGVSESPHYVGGRDDFDRLPPIWLPHIVSRFGYAF